VDAPHLTGYPMPEYIETQGPDGVPVVVEITDAALSTIGRAAAIDAALAASDPTPTQPRIRAQERET